MRPGTQRGEQSSLQRLQHQRQRAETQRKGQGRGAGDREDGSDRGPTASFRSRSQCRDAEVRREPTGVPQSEAQGQRLGPRAPVWGQGSGPWMGQLGNAAWGLLGAGYQGWGSSRPSALSPHPASQGQTQGHSQLPRRAYWAARVAFKIGRSGYFREAPSWLSPSAGAGPPHSGGPWLSTPCGLNSRERPGRSPWLW